MKKTTKDMINELESFAELDARLSEVDGGVEELEAVDLIGTWSQVSDLGRVREAITFDRHGSGYSLVKIKYQDSKVLSITKLKPDAEGLALDSARQELNRIMLNLKKHPSDNDPVKPSKK